MKIQNGPAAKAGLEIKDVILKWRVARFMAHLVYWKLSPVIGLVMSLMFDTARWKEKGGFHTPAGS